MSACLPPRPTRSALTIRCLAATAATVALLGLSGCGSPPHASAPNGASGTSPSAAPLDTCLVGHWLSTSVTGQLADGGGGSVSVKGGAGQVLTIAAGGAITIDDSAAQPDTGTAPDGTTYSVTQTGSSTGHVTSTAGHLVVTLDNPTALTNTISRNGAVLTSGHPGTATDTYTCTPGQTLSVTSSGGVLSQFAPAP